MKCSLLVTTALWLVETLSARGMFRLRSELVPLTHLTVDDRRLVTSSDFKAEIVQLEKLPDAVATAGKIVRFACGLSAGGEVGFTWTKEGNVIISDDRRTIINDVDSSLLTIRRVSVQDAGKYTCIAKNSISEDRQTALLRVEGKS